MAHLEIKTVDASTIEHLLTNIVRRLWGPYRDCMVTIEAVPTAFIQSAVHLAREHRFTMATNLIYAMAAAGVDPFWPVTVRSGATRRLIAGPIAEVSRDRIMLVDGVHRCTAASRLGIEQLTLLCVRSPDADFPPAPGRLCPLDHIGLTDAARTKSQMYRELDPALFRPVGAGATIDRLLNAKFTCH
jgi:hypothetical protein